MVVKNPTIRPIQTNQIFITHRIIFCDLILEKINNETTIMDAVPIVSISSKMNHGKYPMGPHLRGALPYLVERGVDASPANDNKNNNNNGAG